MAGNDYDVSGIILSTYDLTKVGDKGGTLAKMRKILERAAEVSFGTLSVGRNSRLSLLTCVGRR